MARTFNAPEGFGRVGESLPDRCIEPLEGDTLKGKLVDRVKFLETRDLAYGMLGGDRQLLANGGSSTSWT